MNADGSNPRNATSHRARDDHPAWHPDGRRMLFVSDRDGGSDLYLVPGARGAGYCRAGAGQIKLERVVRSTVIWSQGRI